MADNENKNNMLSFDKLREELGITEDEITDIKKDNAEVFDSLPDINSHEQSDIEIESLLEEVSSYSDAKHVTENGITFVDITEKYVTLPQPDDVATKENTLVSDETENVTEQEPEIVASDLSAPKKRVRTFNEIFYDVFGMIFPVKTDSAKEKLRKLVMDISVIAIVVCLIAFVKFFNEYREYSKILDANSLNTQDTTINSDRSSEEWQEVLSDYPNVLFPEKMDVSFAPFYAQNNNFIGWLSLDSSDKFVQVVQGTDNDFYKNHDFYMNESVFGCPYADFRNSFDQLDENTVIYGNSDAENTFFYSLKKYKSLDGYKESPVISFRTIYKTYYYKVFAVLIVSDNSADNSFSYDIVDFSSDTKFSSFVDGIRQRSIIKTDVSIRTDDKLITLVADSNESDGAKLVVVGKMVRDDEGISVDVSKASLNENV